MANNQENGKKRKGSGPGRGWHGHSEEHAKAGRIGGLARRKKSSSDEDQNTPSR